MGKRKKKGGQTKRRSSGKTPAIQTQPPPPAPAVQEAGGAPPAAHAWQAFWQGAGCSWTAVVAFGVVVGIAAGIAAFWPRVTIGWDAPLRARDMLSTPFVVTNSGWLPLTNVWVTCQVDTLATSERQLIANARPIERLIDDDLSPGESLSFGCAVPRGNFFGTAGRQQLVRLSIEIRYNPLWLPRQGTHTEGFRTEPGEGAYLRWVRIEPLRIWRPDYSAR